MYVTYYRHNCSRKHKTFATAAKCIWKWHKITGDGKYAVQTKYYYPHSVGSLCETELFTSLEEAEKAAEYVHHSQISKAKIIILSEKLLEG